MKMTRAIILLLSSLLSAATLASAPANSVRADENQSATVIKALQASFGPALEAAAEFNPFYLTGDFNGDGMQDLLVLVRIKLKRSQLPKDVRVANPFYNDPSYGPAYPDDPAAKARRGFAIIHGSKPGWNAPSPLAKFLLVGESPIRVMFMDVDPKTSMEKSNGLMEVIKKGSKRYRDLHGPSAKGDMINLPTGGAASFLYWNGKAYRWEEYDAD